MVESAFEFAEICRKHDYHNFVFSMKASNPLVMVQAYRLLAEEMYARGWDYPPSHGYDYPPPHHAPPPPYGAHYGAPAPYGGYARGPPPPQYGAHYGAPAPYYDPYAQPPPAAHQAYPPQYPPPRGGGGHLDPHTERQLDQRVAAKRA